MPLRNCAMRRTRPVAARPSQRWLAVTSRLCGLLCALTVAMAGCEAQEGQVIQVFDGDSLRLHESGGAEVEVRLFGIDAPERHQPWSNRSRQALHRLVRGQSLRLVTVTEDRYGRIVATAFRVNDGLDINAEMVREGHAWVYRRYTDDPALIRLEEQARQAGRGLWGLPAADRVPPWQWRRGNRGRGEGETGG